MPKTSKRWAIILLVALALAYGAWKILAAPQPGTFVPSLGRDHVPAGTPVTYNSNPPTSGAHNEKWEKAGIYDQVLPDDKLIHSLEHGYVVISYNCQRSPISNFQFPIFKPAFAHEGEEDEEATDEAEPNPPAENQSTVSQWKDDPNCQSLVSQLRDITNEVGLNRLIVVPRPNLDTRMALTAWTRIDKMDNFDKGRIIAFIKAWRNRGPEKTIEK